MSLSPPFIRRPVATTLLSLGLVVAGVIAFFKLPVSPLPDVDIPTISVQATLPGASPADVATTVASPLERHLGQIANVTEMTSASYLGSARINLPRLAVTSLTQIMPVSRSPFSWRRAAACLMTSLAI